MADVGGPAHAAGAFGRGRGAGPHHRLRPAAGAARPAWRVPNGGVPSGHRGLSLPRDRRNHGDAGRHRDVPAAPRPQEDPGAADSRRVRHTAARVVQRLSSRPLGLTRWLPRVPESDIPPIPPSLTPERNAWLWHCTHSYGYSATFIPL